MRRKLTIMKDLGESSRSTFSKVKFDEKSTGSLLRTSKVEKTTGNLDDSLIEIKDLGTKQTDLLVL